MKKQSLPISIIIFIFILFMQNTSYGDTRITLPLGYTQSDFHDLSKELGLAVSYVPMEPASPMGITGFDVGVEASFVNIHNNKSYWTLVTNSPPSSLIIPKLHVDKGLPAGIDIGLIYSSVPDSNVNLIGGDIKFAILEGSAATPAVAIRGSYTKLTGVTDLNLNTASVDLSISKGFGPVTPYLGVQEVFIQSSASNSALGLNSESIDSSKGFVGAKLSMVIFNLVGQVDIGELPMYSLRLNLGW
ncbi:MAG: hypothetical protein ACHQYP_08355 [Nitrospiria bacterium]